MQNLKNLVLLGIITIGSVSGTLHAQKNNNSSFNTEITAGNSTHIGRITKDSIIVISGSTHMYTVDTTEDNGIVIIKTRVSQLLSQIRYKNGSILQYSISDKNGNAKKEGDIESGDKLVVKSANGKASKTYHLGIMQGAIGGQLRLEKKALTVNTDSDLALYFTAGQRTPNATIRIYIPAGITITEDNTTVNVVGRGDVTLKGLATQSIGRVGTNYPYHKVGNFAISKSADGGSILLFKHLDLRPANGADLKIVIGNINLGRPGKYLFKATYSTSKPEVLTSPGIGSETAILTATRIISDFERVVDKGLQYKESQDTYTKVSFRWGSTKNTSAIQLMQSTDKGNNWTRSSAVIDSKNATATISGLIANKLYSFKLSVKDGEHKGFSNLVYFYSGKMDIKNFGVTGDGVANNTEKINEAIEYLNQLGGGTLLFSEGTYTIRTVHLKSNVWLYVNKGAIIKAIKGADAPE